MKTAVVIFAHGSPIESANESVRAVARAVAAGAGFDIVEPAFLESGRPSLAEAVAGCAARGAGRVLIVPYFLTLGLHLQRDLPRMTAEIAASHPRLRIDVAPPLDGHPALVEALRDRARELG
ncbi:MAG: sirohydrochlorin chelatase [Bryobacteraceae bacterium]